MAATIPCAGWPAGPRGRILAAPAKVNLFLELLDKRPDGYHDLQTLLLPVDLYDTLEIQPRDDGELVLSCDTPGIPTDSKNLVWKAADVFRKENNFAGGVSIHLTKRIPHEAGLGGGSSDAASTLLALHSIWNWHHSISELAVIAAKIGSDIPAFLHPGPTWCTGRGEIAEAIPCAFQMNLVIVKPPFGLSTAEVYRNVKLPPAPTPGDAMRAALARGDLVALGRLMHNRLQPAAFALQPSANMVWEALLVQSPLGAMLSGSGSSVFALARDRADAERIAREAGRVLETSVPGCRVFVVRSI